MADALVAASRAAIARGSRSFALASRLFDAVTRDRATLLYAWCRHADDVIDGQVDGYGRVESVGTPAERLAALERDTRAALCSDRHSRDCGNPGDQPVEGLGSRLRGNDDVRGLPFAALARVATETAMPSRYPLDLIEGFRSDVEERPFRTFDDTLAYCYGVAGCVGVMMAIVMGVSPADRATLERACDLGLAFQLDNIARDVIEDAANGRCYLPEEWLAEAGMTSRHTRHSRESGNLGDQSPEVLGSRLRGNDDACYFAAPHNRVALAAVVARLCDEAERYAASARFGTPALTWRSAWAVLAAADIYGGIGRRVKAEGIAALDRRVTTTGAEKLAAIARALPAALGRRRWASPPSRAGLWTMP